VVALAVKVPANRYRSHTVQRYDAKSETMPNTSLKDGSVAGWWGGEVWGTNNTVVPGCSVQGTKRNEYFKLNKLFSVLNQFLIIQQNRRKFRK